MDRLVYTALSGMQASMNRQRAIASNMANAQTIGFRAEQFDQRPVTLKGTGLEARSMQEGGVRSADMSGGEIVETGRALDVAVNGAALIAVQAPDGSEAYTRRGDLTLSATGLLVNGEGHPVVGDGGPITLPLNSTPSIAPDGTITIDGFYDEVAEPTPAARAAMDSLPFDVDDDRGFLQDRRGLLEKVPGLHADALSLQARGDFEPQVAPLTPQFQFILAAPGGHRCPPSFFFWVSRTCRGTREVPPR